MRPRHAEGGAERRARGLRRAAGMRSNRVRRREPASFPYRWRRMETLVVVGAVFAALGAVFVLLGVRITRASRSFERRAVRAPGHVTDVRWEAVGPAGSKTMTGFPVLRFALPDGRVVETVANSGSTRDVMKEGQAVDVLYDPADPSDARLHGSAGAGVVGTVFTVVGAVFVLLGLALLAAGIALDDALPAVIHS